MNNTKIKLCGLSRIEDISAANELHPDYIGFVFFEKSCRNVSLDKALELKDHLSNEIKAVGVFVDRDISFIKTAAYQKIIDLVQLHGHEDNDYIKALKAEVDLPVIKAVQIKDGLLPDLENISLADYYLLDSGMGSGSAFDWDQVKEKLESLSLDKEIFLAGGLYPENVSDAIEKLHPFAVDVSSGIETNKCKDVDKMRRFVEAARRNTNE